MHMHIHCINCIYICMSGICTCIHTYMYIKNASTRILTWSGSVAWKWMLEMGRVCWVREEDCPLLGEGGGLSVAGWWGGLSVAGWWGGLSVAGWGRRAVSCWVMRRIVSCWVREEDCQLLGEGGGLSAAGWWGGLSVAGWGRRDVSCWVMRRIVSCWVREEDCLLLGERGKWRRGNGLEWRGVRWEGRIG